MPQDQRDQPLDLSPASMRMPSNSDLSPAALIHDTLDTEMWDGNIDGMRVKPGFGLDKLESNIITFNVN